MALPLTPARIAAAYDMLRAFPPFSRWNLPEADEVEINLDRDNDNHATYTRYIGTDEHILGFDSTTVWTLDLLLMFTAHELIHLRQERTKTFTKAMHNADFKRKARSICKAFGWKFDAFMGG